MKLTVTQENLSRALSTVSRVASTRASLPVLSNVLLKTSNNRLLLAATNLDIAITETIGAKVETEGAVTVPARLMQDFIGSLPAGSLQLEVTDGALHLSADRFDSTIHGMSPEEFPVMPTLESGTSVSFAADELKQALSSVLFAASSDEARPVLTGVYFSSEKSSLCVAATDSYRLAEQKISKDIADTSLLVPAKALTEVLRVIKDSEPVEVSYDDQQARFVVGDIEIVTRLVDGEYPDYRKLLPGSYATSAVLSRKDLSEITKVSSLFAREAAGSITIKIDSTAKSLSVQSIASQVGENVANAPAEVEGDAEITLNSRYILDALGAFGGERIKIGVNGTLDPCVLTDPDDNNYLHVIMPVKS